MNGVWEDGGTSFAMASMIESLAWWREWRRGGENGIGEVIGEEYLESERREMETGERQRCEFRDCFTDYHQ